MSFVSWADHDLALASNSFISYLVWSFLSLMLSFFPGQVWSTWFDRWSFSTSTIFWLSEYLLLYCFIWTLAIVYDIWLSSAKMKSVPNKETRASKTHHLLWGECANVFYMGSLLDPTRRLCSLIRGLFCT